MTRLYVIVTDKQAVLARLTERTALKISSLGVTVKAAPVEES